MNKDYCITIKIFSWSFLFHSIKNIFLELSLSFHFLIKMKKVNKCVLEAQKCKQFSSRSISAGSRVDLWIIDNGTVRDGDMSVHLSVINLASVLLTS